MRHERPIPGGGASSQLSKTLLLVVLFLPACSGSPEQGSSIAQRKATRRAAAERLANREPTRHTYPFGNGELVVMDVPIVAQGGFADSQKCFLWRDAEFKTASLQCPNDSLGELAPGGAELESNQP